MKKVVITFVLVLLLVVSIVSAANTTADTSSSSCTGFWGKISCFIFGDAAKRTAVGGWDNE